MNIISKDDTGLKSNYARRRDRMNSFIFILFLAPLTLGLIVFVIAPILWGLVISFFNARGSLDLNEFVGIKNYILLFREQAFVKSIVLIFSYGIFIVPVTVGFSLFLAVLVSRIQKGKGFFRTVFFIPMACSYVVASMIWRMAIFNGMRFGLVNAFIKLFHISPILWTSTSPAVWMALATVRLWIQVGLFMIIYITGIEEIPGDLYEAARVDGAESGWVVFKNITWPLLHNTTIFVVFMNIINLFKSFDEFYQILVDSVSSDNLALARTPLIYLYQTGFLGQDFGKSSAGAIVVALLIVLCTRIQTIITGTGKSVRD